ncbi:MAG: Transcriptional adapter ada2 [Alyxoria varia]|nr:MAG: Transcriptional adapter ada2 [Alyxoria varia]
MGVIKKKTAVRGTEGGTKYICEICSVDITATVRIHCVDPACKDYDLCVTCFSNGEKSHQHKPESHCYQVVEQHSVPIFTDDWGADEESLLLEGAETYGLGSWADIADHIGGYREKDEVRDHYINTYIKSSNFPLPEHASPADRRLAEEWPREKFQARKKRRIEERREAARDAPPAPPKKKPTSSVPACHEVQGYMPGRLEFEVEHLNDAEEAVQHMQFEAGEGIPSASGELDPETVLKMTVMDMYNSKLDARVERKRFIFEQELLEYRRNTAFERKKTKEERDLYNKLKPFARVMGKQDFDTFSQDLEKELNLRVAISQLQEWRSLKIADCQTGQRYENEKAMRAARIAASNNYERFATNSRPPKDVKNQIETNSSVTALTSGELPFRISETQPGNDHTKERTPLADGNANANAANTPVSAQQRPKFTPTPLPHNNSGPLKLTNENSPDLHLLTEDERELCSQLRIRPKPYIAIKDSIIREAVKHGGSIKKKAAKEISRIDKDKGGRLFDFFVYSGWIAKA